MATLKDVAKLSGVSESTASRSLRDMPVISEKTRQRVKIAAKELNFEFNAVARGLSTSRRYIAGIVYPDFDQEFHRSYYLDLLVHSIRHELENAGYDCLIFQARDANGQSNIRRLVLQKKVDGLVCVLSNISREDWTLIADNAMPIVQVHSRPANRDKSHPGETYDYFYTNNSLGGELVARHLVDKGATRFLCLTDDSQGPEMEDRQKGFCLQLQYLGVSSKRILVLSSNSSHESVCRYVSTQIKKFQNYDGLFAHTDIMALAAMQTLQYNGIRAPDDIRIVGFDDIPLCSLSVPTLTSVHQPREEQAMQASRRLIALIEKKGENNCQGTVSHELIDPWLVVRESSG